MRQVQDIRSRTSTGPRIDRARRICIASVVLFAAAPISAQGREPAFPTGPYKYIVLDQELRDVLTEYGRNTGMVVQLSDDVHGRVRGPLPAATAEGFLKRLCETYGLVWYYDGAVLYINAASELRTELINLGAMRADDVSSRLKDVGLVDPRFSLNVTADAGVMTVSGPPPYVQRVRDMLAALTKAREQRPVDPGDDSRVRVFRGG
jgi:type II secretory pathway component GspD/PulD (secretin)